MKSRGMTCLKGTEQKSQNIFGVASIPRAGRSWFTGVMLRNWYQRTYLAFLYDGGGVYLFRNQREEGNICSREHSLLVSLIFMYIVMTLLNIEVLILYILQRPISSFYSKLSPLTCFNTGLGMTLVQFYFELDITSTMCIRTALANSHEARVAILVHCLIIISADRNAPPWDFHILKFS